MTDDFLLDDDEDDDLDTRGVDPEKAKLMRQNGALRKENKALKAQESEVAELRAFKQNYDTQVRQSEVAAVGKELGLPEQWSKLYVQLNPEETEVSKDKLAEWAVGLGFIEKQETAAPESRSFAPRTVGTATPVNDSISREEWVELQSRNPELAMQYYAEHRVTGLAPTNNDAEEVRRFLDMPKALNTEQQERFGMGEQNDPRGPLR